MVRVCSALCFLLFLAGCGKAPTPSKAQLSKSASCPLYFSAENLCARLEWVEEPKDNQPMHYTLSFFDPSTGPVEPKTKPESFVQMVCCKSLLFPKIVAVEPGKFSASGPLFISGTWDVFVRLGSEDQVVQVIVP